MTIATTAASAWTSSDINALSTTDITNLTTLQLSALGTAQTQYLTAAQVSAVLPTTGTAASTAGIAKISAAALNALTSDAFVGLTSNNAPSLTSTQIAGLSSAHITELSTNSDLQYIAPAAIPGISTTGGTSAPIAGLTVSALSTAQFVALTTAQLNALSSVQIQNISTAEAAALTTAQATALTSAQTQYLTSAQIDALPSATLTKLTPAAFEALDATATTAGFSGLNATNAPGITSAQIAALDSAHIAALNANSDLTLIPAAAIPGISTTGGTSAPIAGLTVEGLTTGAAGQFAALTPAQLNALTSTQVQAITTAEAAALTTAQATGLNATQSALLDSAQVSALTSADVHNISTASFAALTTADGFAGLTSVNAVGITSAQIAALDSAHIAALGTNFIGGDTTAAPELQLIPNAALAGLTTANIAGLDATKLSGAQFSSLPPAIFKIIPAGQKSALSDSTIAGLTSAQVAVLSTDDIHAFTPTQIGLLTPAAILGLTTAQANTLTGGQVAALSSTTLTSLPPADFAALSSDGLSGLHENASGVIAAQIAVLSTAQIQQLGVNDDLKFISDSALTGLTTAQITNLDFSQLATNATISNLTPATLKLISPAQLSNMPTEVVHSLSSAQTAVLTSDHIAALSAGQVTALTGGATGALAAIPATIIANLSADGLSGLDANTGSLTSAQVGALSATQITALGTNDDLHNISNTALAGLLTTTTATVTGTPVTTTISTGVVPSYTAAAGAVAAYYTVASASVIAASTLHLNDVFSFANTQSLAYDTTAITTAIADGKYELIKGTYAATGAKFTPVSAGLDTLVVFDNGASTAVTTLSFVLTGITPDKFVTSVAGKFTVNTGTAATVAAPTNISGLDVGKLTPDQLAHLTTAQLNVLSSAQVGEITSDLASALTTVQTANLNATMVANLSAEAIGSLSEPALAAIPAAKFTQLTHLEGLDANAHGVTNGQIAALTSTQITALGTNGDLQFITPAALAGLTTANIAGLHTELLNDAQLAALTSTQLNTLTANVQVPAITAEQVANFTAGEVRAFPTAFVHELTDVQVGALTGATLAALPPASFAALSAAGLAGLGSGAVDNTGSVTDAQIRALSSAQITALGTNGDLENINPSSLAGLTVANISGLDVALLTAAQFNALTPNQLASLGTSAIGIAHIDAEKAALLGSADVAALSSAQVGLLTVEAIPALGTASSSSAIAGLTAKNVGGLTSSQIAALTEAQAAALTPDAVKGLTTAQTAHLTGADLAAILPNTLASMTPAALAAVVSTEFASITTAQVTTLTPAQVGALVTNQINVLNADQSSALTSAQVAKLGTADVNALTVDAIGSLDPSVISKLAINSAFTSAQLGAMTPEQVANLTPNQLGATLTATNAPGLTVDQVTVVVANGNALAKGISDLSALTNPAIAAVGSDVIAALTTAQLDKLKPAQVGALTDTQVEALHSTPTDQLAWAYNKGYTVVTSAAHDVTSHSIETSPTVTPTVTGTAGVVITGGIKATAITGTDFNDTITGGAGADTINGGKGDDVLTGNGGADKFVFTSPSTTAPSNAHFDEITDFNTGIKDTISMTALSMAGDTTSAAASTVAKIKNGVASFSSNDTTLAQHIVAVEKGLTGSTAAAATKTVAGAAAIWEEGSDSFLFVSDGTAGVSATDVLIKLDGIQATGMTIKNNLFTGVIDTVAPTPTLTNSASPLNALAVASVQSDEIGTAYLVLDGVKPTVNASTKAVTFSGSAHDNSTSGGSYALVNIDTIDTATDLPVANLVGGSYHLYAVDNSGNLSVMSTNKIVVDTTPPATPVIASTLATSTAPAVAVTGAATVNVASTASVNVSSTEAGVKAFLVNSSVVNPTSDDLTAATSNLVKSVTTFGATVKTGAITVNGLDEGTYHVYTEDAAGNVSAASAAAILLDSTVPDAPSAVTVTTTGGTLVPNAVNGTNTEFKVTADISPVSVVDDGGYAELFVGTSLVGKTGAIPAGSTAVTFDFTGSTAASWTSTTETAPLAPALKLAGTGGVVTVELFDKAGNHATSTDANPTLLVDTVAPAAATAITLTPVGSPVVANTLNDVNTNLTATATIVAGQATGGSAELYVGTVDASHLFATDSNIASGDTALAFDVMSASSAASLQQAVQTGGAVTVKLIDAAGNASLNTVKPTLSVDYVAPAADAAPTEAGSTFLTNGVSAAEATKVIKINANLAGTGSAGTLAVAGDTVSLWSTDANGVETPVIGATHVLTAADVAYASSAFTTPYAFTLPLGSVADTVNGSSVVTASSPLATDGLKTLTTKVTDKAGNIGAESTALTFTVDKTAPTKTLAPADGSASGMLADGVNLAEFTAANASTPIPISIGLDNSGAVAGDSIALLLGGKAITNVAAYTLQAADIAANAYTFNLSGTNLGADGSKSLTAVVTDIAGNVGTASDPFTFPVDTTAPAAAAVSTAAFSSNGTPAGTLTATTSVNAAQIGGNIIVTTSLAKTGAKVGDTVDLILNGGTSSPEATKVLTQTEIDAGKYAFTVPGADLSAASTQAFKTKITDVAGNASPLSAPLNVTLDVTAPTAPTLAPSVLVNSSLSDYIVNAAEAAAPIKVHANVAGSSAVAGDSVSLFLGGSTITGVAAHKLITSELTNGYDFTVPANTLSGSGEKDFTVQFTDAAGNVGTASDPLAVTLDTTAPAITLTSSVSNIAIASNTGAVVSSSVNYVNKGDTVTVTVPFDNTVLVTGTPKLNLTVGSSPVSAVYTTGSGSDSLSFTYTVGAGQNGTGIVVPTGATVLSGGTIKGLSGNPAILTNTVVTDATYVVDTTPPSAGAAPAEKSGNVVLAATGTNAVGALNTMNAAEKAGDLVITAPLPANAVAGDTVELLVNGGSFSSALIGTVVSGTPVTLADFTVPGGTLGADGVKSLTTKVTDIAGNVGAASTALTFTLDSGIPNAPTFATNEAGTDNIINSTEKAAGVSITGTAEAGSTVALSIPQGTGGTGSTAVHSVKAAANGTWTYALAASDYTVIGTGTTLSATATDAAGNASSATTKAITVDMVAPTVGITSSVAAVKIGETATITATFSEPVTGFTVGDFTSAAGAFSSFTTTDSSHYTAVFTPTASSTATSAGITIAASSYQDLAGYDGGAGTTPVLAMDMIAPTASVTAATVANTANVTTVQSTETGTAYLVKDSITVTNLASITGAADTSWNQATITTANTNTNLAATGLVDGTYKVYTVDAAGNLSAASTNAITVDTTAPTASVTAATVANTANVTTVQSTETGTAYLVKDSITVTNLASITGAADTSWNQATITTANTNTNLAATGLVDGTYKVYTVDAAGNLSAASTNAITVDTTAPAAAATPVTYSDGSAGDSNASTHFAATDIITLAFSEALSSVGTVTVNDAGSSSNHVHILATSGTPGTLTLAGNGLSATFTADSGTTVAATDHIILTGATDLAGNTATLDFTLA